MAAQPKRGCCQDRRQRARSGVSTWTPRQRGDLATAPCRTRRRTSVRTTGWRTARPCRLRSALSLANPRPRQSGRPHNALVPTEERRGLVSLTNRPHAQMRLLCFHHAGGGASSFRTWMAAMPSYLELVAYELPGHGARIREPLFTDMVAATHDIAPEIEAGLGLPYIIFGYSLGAHLAYRVSHLLAARGHGPEELVVAGFGAPGSPRRRRRAHELSDAELVNVLRRFGGTPSAVFECDDLLELVLPIFRADLLLSEAEAPEAEPPLSIPVTALGGMDDEVVPLDDLLRWRTKTTKRFRALLFPGGHFFVHEPSNGVPGMLATLLRPERRP